MNVSAYHTTKHFGFCCHVASTQHEETIIDYQLPVVDEGAWYRSGSGKSTQGIDTIRVYALKDGQVVYANEMLWHRCVSFGEHGTIDLPRALFYAILLQGYEPVVLLPGERRPNRCRWYDEAMSIDREWHMSEDDYQARAALGLELTD